MYHYTGVCSPSRRCETLLFLAYHSFPLRSLAQKLSYVYTIAKGKRTQTEMGHVKPTMYGLICRRLPDIIILDGKSIIIFPRVNGHLSLDMDFN